MIIRDCLTTSNHEVCGSSRHLFLVLAENEKTKLAGKENIDAQERISCQNKPAQNVTVMFLFGFQTVAFLVLNRARSIAEIQTSVISRNSKVYKKGNPPFYVFSSRWPMIRSGLAKPVRVLFRNQISLEFCRGSQNSQD